MENYALGIDIGGSKTLLVVLNSKNNIVYKNKVPSSKDWEYLVELIKQSIDELKDNLLICPVNQMIDKLNLYAEAGIDEVIFSSSFGQSQKETMESMKRISDYVIPHFKEANTYVA